MDSWLKAAEDLFEVVDRRAKLVVNDLSDEQSDLHLLDSNGKGTQHKRTNSRVKARKSVSSFDPSKLGEVEQSSAQISASDITLNMIRSPLPPENDEIISHNFMFEEGNEVLHVDEKDAITLGISSAETLPYIESNDVPNNTEVLVIDTKADAATSSSNSELAINNSSDVQEGPNLSVETDGGVADLSEHHLDDAIWSNKLDDSDIPPIIDKRHIQSLIVGAPNNGDTQRIDTDFNQCPIIIQNEHENQRSDNPSLQAQDQLEEAQGLLKNAISSGKSKEARLARVCAGLSSRLQEYKSENAQLDELLSAERELCKSYEDRIKHIQQELSASNVELTRAESNMVEALSAKNSEIEALVHSMDVLKKQAVLSEGNMASLQANMESIMRNKELTATRMMQALREELASVVQRAEEERTAHNAMKMAAMEREVELEHRALEASTAIARIQRVADERTIKATELEQKVAMLEMECASLNHELQDMESLARRGQSEQKKSLDDANQLIQLQEMRDEVERSRQGQRNAESRFSSLEAEAQNMRVEIAAIKRDAEHYSRQEHVELEKRYRELTDLLYYKQTQLEAMAGENASLKFQMEKEMKRLQEARVELERNRVPRRASSSWEEDTDLNALEPLPLHHRHMAGANIQLQKAAKLLDSGAVRATRFLWRYPTARLLLLLYLVFVHLFLMYLLHRLQEQADNLGSKEVAESMGLANPTFK